MDLSIGSVVHCLFEQSGTFKKEFEKLGLRSFDYDIDNSFGETDFQVDLFKEIENAFNCKKSIFDNFVRNDLIIAFFPCTRFTKRMKVNYKRTSTGFVNFSIENKLLQNIKYFSETEYLYKILNYLCIVCIRKNLKLIIENPYQKDHILTQFFFFEPAIVDYNRHKMGDYYCKPTQYFFINCEPNFNNEVDLLNYYDSYKCINDINNKIERSLISPTYANLFIRNFIL